MGESLTDMAHPWLNAQDVSTFVASVPGNPDRRESRISTTSDNLNFREETIEDVRAAWCDKEGNEDDTVLSYAVIEKDADGHDS